MIAQLAHTLTNKLLHAPCTGLRDAVASGDSDAAAVIAKLYRQYSPGN